MSNGASSTGKQLQPSTFYESESGGGVSSGGKHLYLWAWKRTKEILSLAGEPWRIYTRLRRSIGAANEDCINKMWFCTMSK